MKELLGSIKTGLLQRIESPLIGTFSILFVIFNWRAFAVFLFSAKPIEERLSYIEQTYSSQCYYLWLPALFSLLITFAHPGAAYWITKYLLWLEEKKRGMRSQLKANELNDQIATKKQEVEMRLLEGELEDQRLRNKATEALIDGLGKSLHTGEANAMNNAIPTLKRIAAKNTS